MKRLANRIQQKLNQQGKTQSWLAKEVGMTTVGLNILISLKRSPGGLTMSKIAKALNCTMDELFYQEEWNPIVVTAKALATMATVYAACWIMLYSISANYYIYDNCGETAFSIRHKSRAITFYTSMQHPVKIQKIINQ